MPAEDIKLRRRIERLTAEIEKLRRALERKDHPNENQCETCGKWNHERDSTYHCRCGMDVDPTATEARAAAMWSNADPPDGSGVAG